MSVYNSTLLKAAAPLAVASSILPLLDPMIDAGTKFLFDYTNGSDCMAAIADGATIANGALVTNLVAGGATASFVDDGTHHFTAVAGRKGVSAGGGGFTSYLNLGSPGYDLSANPLNEFLLTHCFKVPATGYSTSAFELIGLTNPRQSSNTDQWGLSTFNSGGLGIGGTVNGFAADGTTAKVAQVSQASAITPGTILHAALHWAPQKIELFVNGSLVAQSSSTSVPYMLKSMAAGGASLFCAAIATHYRSALHDLTAGGQSAAVKAAAEYAFFAQRLVDLGIA